MTVGFEKLLGRDTRADRSRRGGRPGATPSLLGLMLALLGALSPASSQAQFATMNIRGNGAFHSSTPPFPWQSTWAQGCVDTGTPTWYYEDLSQFNLQAWADGQPQCQNAGTGFGFVPQVVSCGTQGYCMRFATAPASSGDYGRSEMAVHNEVPLRQWHYFAFRFKFPNSLQPPMASNPDERGNNIFFGQIFHQAGLPRPAGSDAPKPIGGFALAQGAPLRWSFGAHWGKETRQVVQGQFAYVWNQEFNDGRPPITGKGFSTVIPAQEVQPEVWQFVEMVFYIDPDTNVINPNPDGSNASATTNFFYAINGGPVQHWRGNIGAGYHPDYWADQGRKSTHFDPKIGIYTPPLVNEMRVYLDDVVFRTNVWGASTHTIRHKDSGLCLDVRDYGTWNGARVQIYDCQEGGLGSGNQRWTMDDLGRIKSEASGRCLDVVGNGTADETLVQIWDCGGESAKNQRWKWTAAGELMSLASGKCLVSTGPDNTRSAVIRTCAYPNQMVWRTQ